MSTSAPTALPVYITSLTKYFGAFCAVDDVSFDIAAGEFLTLLGPSGSGKTTLLMMLAGFARPTRGSVRLGEQEVIHLPPHKRNIGMVFQNYALFPHMSVGENIAYPLRLRGVGKAECADRVRKTLDLVQLSNYQDRRVNELSGGQRQRIALARAIVFEPRILLMDEPLSALDKQLRETMQIEIRRLHNRLGMTTISVTHDQREALTMSDRVAVFSRGKLAQVATPADLYEKPASRFIADFIGESSFVPVAQVSGGLTYGGELIRLADPSDATRPNPMLMLRPERLRIARSGQVARDERTNVFSGMVENVVFQGESLLIEVKLDHGGLVHVRQVNRADELQNRPSAGDRIDLVLSQLDTRIVRAED
ncbi:ABC transporter ATP-binding protein [Rhizobium sp. TH2]|uniref:ABC transporter ATP-binding protein n=1 Tax=Rhizobium sp. TH2 TaxID=2775403 RepID=UPI00215784DC|nr:ABC transporter ATP-binding protein [Rhizobium sp. TH2]UVC10538.1 ABC transporter ATP-binding protein [Rhizobium sp. TH2]